jgi:hypothetical protein
MPPLSPSPPSLSLPPILPAAGGRSMRPPRPHLPKIDPSLGCELDNIGHERDVNNCLAHKQFSGELTPLSSGHNSLTSPGSTGSGPRSPWLATRKGSLPGPRRPPSPELTNLDCAFPPFPIATRSGTTKKRDRPGTQRSETKRSRSRDTAHRDGEDAGRRLPLTNVESPIATFVPPAPIPAILHQPRAPSPLSSETKGLDLEPHSQSPSIATLPDDLVNALQQAGQAAAHARKPSSVKDELKDLPDIKTAQLEGVSEHPTVDPGLSSFDFGVTAIDPSSSSQAAPSSQDRLRADTEPAYKTKRPPPITSQGNPALSSLAKLSSAPQSSPISGGFSKSLGRLFGRRTSQSALRRDVARQALSDDIESPENQIDSPNVLSPGSDLSFHTAEPSPLEHSPSRSPYFTEHEESLIKGEMNFNPPAMPDLVEPEKPPVQPTTNEKADDPDRIQPIEDTLIESLPEIYTTPDPQGTDLIEALRRVSIDSASSYGSIGFTERTTSSRSTAPQIEISSSDCIAPAGLAITKLADVDLPPPLRPHVQEIPPDSPTDPLFQQGRLSPIPDIPPRSKRSIDLVPAIHIQPEPQTSLTVKNLSPKIGSGKSSTPNKGVCRGCSELILVGQKSVSSADGLLSGKYHKSCFVCHTCKTAFATAEFYVHKDQPYCAHHYHELENSLCASCGKGIEGLYMETANVAGRGKEKHHPECLQCTTCNIRLDHDYFELSGKVYCERDAFRLAVVPKPHDNAPNRPSPLVREYISSGNPGLAGRNFPERRTTKLMNMI